MKRLECLDGLRGLLATYVLLGHMAPFAVLPGWLQDLLSHGGAAVDVFFVLSGLVITQSLDKVHGEAVPFLYARAAGAPGLQSVGQFRSHGHERAAAAARRCATMSMVASLEGSKRGNLSLGSLRC